MNKISFMLTIFCLINFFSFANKIVAAEEQAPYVKNANIEIILIDNIYSVKEKVVISNVQGVEDGKIEYLVKQITENKVGNVKFSVEGIELIPEVIKGEKLDKYIIEINSGDMQDVEYLIEYTVNKADRVFEVPLFVPEYAPKGELRSVHLRFQAPEGQVIQKNSFPILNESGLNIIEKDMANIPAMTKFLLSEKPNPLNLFNVISAIAIISLFLMLLYWGLYEMRKNRREANGN